MKFIKNLNLQKRMKKVYDINSNLVEVGDLIIIPKNSTLTKSYVLGFNNSSMIVSCCRDNKKVGRYCKQPDGSYGRKTIQLKNFTGDI